MLAKIKFSVALLLIVWSLCSPASAQDDGQPAPEVEELNSHPELNLNDDKTLLMDADAKPSKGPNREASTPVNTSKNKQENLNQPKATVSAEKTEEDPLSFNFLYFIIQKFKFSDIVDD